MYIFGDPNFTIQNSRFVQRSPAFRRKSIMFAQSCWGLQIEVSSVSCGSKTLPGRSSVRTDNIWVI